jgi:hypothetical protein
MFRFVEIDCVSLEIRLILVFAEFGNWILNKYVPRFGMPSYTEVRPFLLVEMPTFQFVWQSKGFYFAAMTFANLSIEVKIKTIVSK